MKGAVGTENGLELRELPRPEPKANEVLVRVRAAGLNRADLNAARAKAPGHIQAGNPIGLEWAGEVAEVGSEVKGIKPGDHVLASGSGGYAEYAVCDFGRIIPMPAAGMSFEEAGSLSLALLTMHDAIVSNGRFKPGESVLIQGASSGVGIMGLMIARHTGAKLVIGTSTNAARRERLKQFGADLALDSRNPNWPDAALKATGGKGVNLIVDMVSGPVANQNMKAAAVLGRIVNVGRLGGLKAEFDFDLHALRRIDYVGVTFRTRSVEEVREIVRRMRADLWDAVAAGKLRLPIDKIFPLDQAAAAQEYMKSSAHFGKIVLRP
jgi:NADPH2:quinone reductase